jgi:hypothetical protein
MLQYGLTKSAGTRTNNQNTLILRSAATTKEATPPNRQQPLFMVCAFVGNCL